VKTKLTAFFAGVALAGSMLFASAGIATAAGPAAGGLPGAGPAGKDICATQAAAVKAGATVDTLRAFGDCEINRRFTTMTALSAKVTGSKVLTSSDAAALQAEISSTTSGLTSLKAAIDSETNVAALKADIVKIATDYRVYLLVVRQVNLVNGADGVAAAQARFATVSTTLTTRIAAATAAGKDTAAAQADLDAMKASVTAAAGLAAPLPATLLALTPAQYNAGTAGPVMDSAKTALGHARDDLKSALASAKACREALK
jgi:hypothetical protein